MTFETTLEYPTDKYLKQAQTISVTAAECFLSNPSAI